jgi:hypothetical protein
MRYFAVLVLLFVLVGSQAALGAQPAADTFQCSGTIEVPAGKVLVRTAPNPDCASPMNAVATVNSPGSGPGYSNVWVRSVHAYGDGQVIIYLNTRDHAVAVEVAWVAFESP